MLDRFRVEHCGDYEWDDNPKGVTTRKLDFQIDAMTCRSRFPEIGDFTQFDFFFNQPHNNSLDSKRLPVNIVMFKHLQKQRWGENLVYAKDAI
jgi:hypothetical protein